MDAFKQRLTDHCRFILERKIELLSFSIDEITMSMEGETKSSAGDKHETARARMQAEQARLEKQMQELKNQALEFERTNFDEDDDVVKSGKLVETNHGTFLICIALGKLEFEEKMVYVISPVSPLAEKMKGLKGNVEFSFNNTNYKIAGVV